MLIGIMGKMSAGKTTLAKGLHRTRDFEHTAFGNALKGMLVKAGLVKRSDLLKKPPATRWLLQKVGTELIRDQIDPDFWLKKMDERLETVAPGVDIVIDDIRFRNEAEYVWNREGLIILVVRPDRENNSNHRSEKELEGITPDYKIVNNSSIATFLKHGYKVIDEIRGCANG